MDGAINQLGTRLGDGLAALWAIARQALIHVLAVALFRTLLAMVLVWLNPFHFNNWSDERSRAIWQQISAPFYPVTPQLGGLVRLTGEQISEGLVGIFRPPTDTEPPPVAFRSAGRSNIVVLASDANWPPRGRIVRQADIIELLQYLPVPQPDGRRPVAGQQPLAVFVDFIANPVEGVTEQEVLAMPATGAICNNAVTDQRQLTRCLARAVAAATSYRQWAGKAECQANPVAKLRCILDAKGVPIMLATSTPARELDARSSLALLGRVGLLVNIRVGTDRLSLLDGDSRQTAGQSWGLSAPAALFLSACLQPVQVRAPIPACEALNGLDRRDRPLPIQAGWPQGLAGELMPVAGLHPETLLDRSLAKVEQGRIDQRCLTANAAQANWLHYLGTMLAPGVFGDKVMGKAYCPYADHLRVNTLLGDAMVTPGLMARRLVLIGDDRPGTADRHAMPPFEAIAGVFVMAMATDNLLEHGVDFQRPLTRTQEVVRTAAGVFLVSVLTSALALGLKFCGNHIVRVSMLAVLTLAVMILAILLLMSQAIDAGGFNRMLVLIFLVHGVMGVEISACRSLIGNIPSKGSKR